MIHLIGNAKDTKGDLLESQAVNISDFKHVVKKNTDLIMNINFGGTAEVWDNLEESVW